jgi:predicted aconitase with swiveling domain
MGEMRDVRPQHSLISPSIPTWEGGPEQSMEIESGKIVLHGRKIFQGQARGEALVTSMGISFYGGVDPDRGIVVEKGHELEGQSVSGRILVFPTGKGSTVGSYTLYRLKHNGKAPAAIVNAECETITAVGCIIAEIPCVDQIPIWELQSGSHLLVDGARGIVEILEQP